MAAMAPQMRQMFSNPQFQQMISNPDALRQMFQMAGQMRAAGIDPTNPASLGLGGVPPAMPFGLFGPGAFGAGAGAGSTPAGGATDGSAGAGSQPTNLFAQAAGGAASATGAGLPPAANPWGALFGASPGAGAGGGVSPTGTGAPANPFGMVDPNLMQQMFGGFGGGFPGAGAGAPAAPTDSRPPEERFQVQLQVRFCNLEELSKRRCR